MQGSSLLKKIDLLNHIQHGIIVIDANGIILYWNSVSQEIFGYTLEEVSGKSMKILHDEKDHRKFEQLLNQCQNKKKYSGKWHAKRKDNSQVWLDVKSSTLYDEENGKQYCVITLNNIEPLETVKENLKKATLLEKTVLETSADAIITTDEGGIILGFNRAAIKMFGYEKEEIIGENIRMIIPSFHRKNLGILLKQYKWRMETIKKSDDVDIQGKRKDGSDFYINMSVSDVHWNSERMFVGIIRDLTQKRELEKQMIHIANEERRRIGRELHDGLGQMLTGIRMVAESLARKLKANEVPGASEVLEISEMIKEADEHTRALSRGLVEIHLVEQGLKTALEDFVERIPKMFDVNCNLTVEGEIDVENHTMALHIYRIVQESITNAVRHSDAKNINIHLLKDDHTTITIEDDGTGFKLKEFSENGSGLKIMKHRANLLGGTLEIYRTDSGKTRVQCIIPNNFEQYEGTNE